MHSSNLSSGLTALSNMRGILLNRTVFAVNRRQFLASYVRFHAIPESSSEPTSSSSSSSSSAAAAEPPMEHKLSNKELRERAIAEALAREEAALQKQKEIVLMTQRSQELIDTLNKTPTVLINERIAKLNEDLSGLPGDKVKQLDEDLKEYILANMKLTEELSKNRPWYSKEDAKKTDSSASEDAGPGESSSSSVTSQYSSQYPNLRPTPEYKNYSEYELYIRQLNYLRTTASLGSKMKHVYKPERDTHTPTNISKTTISTLLAAGCHFGQSVASFRPSFQPFVYGTYNGVHVIDLNKTLEQLQLACKVIEGVSEKGGSILFVGTHKNWSIRESLIAAANRSRGYYVSKRWIPGTITNYVEVTKQILDPFQKQQIDMADEVISTGKEHNLIIKPDLVVLLNPVENRNCIKECLAACIPTIGLCDSDMEPSLLTYPIPCNDDGVRSVNLMLGVMSKAAETGLNRRLGVVKQLRDEENRRREKQQNAIEAADEEF